ncbi:hypothetical protein NC652_039330 [Populus alba x Populus x berolinensis]|nr:hypothetical protein NC652_039330 [Populus alba x Populus x berolinensis]
MIVEDKGPDGNYSCHLATQGTECIINSEFLIKLSNL